MDPSRTPFPSPKEEESPTAPVMPHRQGLLPQDRDQGYENDSWDGGSSPGSEAGVAEATATTSRGAVFSKDDEGSMASPASMATVASKSPPRLETVQEESVTFSPVVSPQVSPLSSPKVSPKGPHKAHEVFLGPTNTSHILDILDKLAETSPTSSMSDSKGKRKSDASYGETKRLRADTVDWSVETGEVKPREAAPRSRKRLWIAVSAILMLLFAIGLVATPTDTIGPVATPTGTTARFIRLYSQWEHDNQELDRVLQSHMAKKFDETKLAPWLEPCLDVMRTTVAFVPKPTKDNHKTLEDLALVTNFLEVNLLAWASLRQAVHLLEEFASVGPPHNRSTTIEAQSQTFSKTVIEFDNLKESLGMVLNGTVEMLEKMVLQEEVRNSAPHKPATFLMNLVYSVVNSAVVVMAVAFWIRNNP
jgi:hypothetical protein